MGLFWSINPLKKEGWNLYLLEREVLEYLQPEIREAHPKR